MATQHDPVQILVHIPISKRPTIHPPQTTTTAGQTDPGTWDPSTAVAVKPSPKPAQTIHQAVQPQGLQTMPDPHAPPERQGILGAYPQHQHNHHPHHHHQRH